MHQFSTTYNQKITDDTEFRIRQARYESDRRHVLSNALLSWEMSFQAGKYSQAREWWVTVVQPLIAEGVRPE